MRAVTGETPSTAPPTAPAPAKPPVPSGLERLQRAVDAAHPRAAALELQVGHLLGQGVGELSEGQLDAAEDVLWSLLRGVQAAKVAAAAERERTRVVAEEVHKRQMADLLSRGDK